jgi:hypothetical protein
MSHRGINLCIELEVEGKWTPILKVDSDLLYFMNQMAGGEEKDILQMYSPVRLRMLVKAVELPDEYVDDANMFEGEDENEEV